MLSTLRLKIKLVIAITAMVVAIVITLSTLYISQVVRQRIRQTSEDGRFVAWEIYQVARDPLQVDLSNARIDVDDPKQVEQAVEEEIGRASCRERVWSWVRGGSLKKTK